MPQCLIYNSNSLYLFNSSLQFKRFPTTLPSKISTNIWHSGCPSRSPQVLHFAKKINADTLINASFGDQEINETEIELLGKPSPIQIDDFLSEEVRKQDLETSVKSNKEEEALAPFLKFFKSKISSTGDNETDVEHSSTKGLKEEKGKKLKQVKVEYYDPKPNDLVVGVVVSGNENKLDVNIGADLLGTMLTKEVLPLHEEQLSYSLCDLGKDAEEFMIPGKIGIIRDEEAFKKELVSGRPVVEVGTVLFAEVLGRTLSGRPLLSSRRFFRRIAWHRVRQIKQLNEPIEVRISEWNTGGLLTRIEGLRAFLPKAELMSKVTNFADLKANVGRRMFVLINRIDEAQNDLIISEKDAWEMLYLREGTLLEGSIQKTFPYGAQVKIGDTNRSGLLHISNISRARIASVIDLFSIDEKVKVLVVKSMFPDKIALSIADLESEPGLFLTNKEKVFAEADEMAKKYRQRLQIVSSTRKMNPPLTDILPFDDEAKAYANWNWFKFQGDEVPATI